MNKERKEGRDPIFDLNGMMLQPPNPGPYAGAVVNVRNGLMDATECHRNAWMMG